MIDYENGSRAVIIVGFLHDTRDRQNMAFVWMEVVSLQIGAINVDGKIGDVMVYSLHNIVIQTNHHVQM